jgi:Tfp pilus assembly protein PilF
MQAGFLAALLLSIAAYGAPHVPANDSTVLERLPAKPNDPVMRELRSLRAALAASPQDAELASRLALRYFDLASAEGDPRYVGYAEAALQPWRNRDAPTQVLFARGVVRQYRHDFAGALEDFEAVVRREPEHVGAHAWRAAIFMVQADYASAERECEALQGNAGELLSSGCSTYVEATTGHTQQAFDELSGALQAHPEASAEARLWVLTRLAEMQWRLGDAGSADRLFRQALALGVDDNFLLAAYADFLLERGRPGEVVEMLKAWRRSDTLLLRLALAEKKLGLRDAAADIQSLGDRFAAAALRGERLHMAEEARYLLDLKGDAHTALAVAAENWKTQREPRDAQIVLESALAARDARPAAPVLLWLDESSFESSRLRSLAEQLRKIS